MSGENVPYHLRWNKSIERSIFMEFLGKLNTVKHLNSFSYIGFGALHMQDFKLVHSLFSINNLTSIEQDEYIYARQQFNKPLACLNLKNTTSGDFITNFNPTTSSIIWLDYASPRQINSQFREAHSLLTKLDRYDVFKITLNANPNSLGEEGEFEKNYAGKKLLREKRFALLKERLSNYLPSSINEDRMIQSEFPAVLLNSIQLLLSRAFKGKSNLIMHPVNSFVYSDSNHRMLTFTGIVINKEEQDTIDNTIGLTNWEYKFIDWDTPHIIDIPDLTIKERMQLDSLLPCKDTNSISDAFEKLNVQFDRNQDKSIKKIEGYIKYYRHFPYFSKVSL